MAGPWFTVQEYGESWNTLSSLWISNGQEDVKGRIDIRVRLTKGESQEQTIKPETTR